MRISDWSSDVCASVLAMPGVDVRSGAPVVRGCRMIKSPAEIALMQLASDVTIAAYRHTHPRIERGMTPSDIGALMNEATPASSEERRVGKECGSRCGSRGSRYQ